MAFFNSINQVSQIAWGLGSQTWDLVTSRKALSFGCLALLAGAGARWAMKPKNDLAGRMCAIPSMQLELINAPFEEQVLDLSVRVCQDFSAEQPSRASLKELEFSSLFVSKYLKDKDPYIQGLAQRGEQACGAAINKCTSILSAEVELWPGLYEATTSARVTQPLKDGLSVLSEAEVYFGPNDQIQPLLDKIREKELIKEELKERAEDALYCQEFFNLKKPEKYDEAQQRVLDEKLLNLLAIYRQYNSEDFLYQWITTCARTSIIHEKWLAIERYEQSKESCLESEHCLNLLPNTATKCRMFSDYSHVQRGIQKIQNFCIKNGFMHSRLAVHKDDASMSTLEKIEKLEICYFEKDATADKFSPMVESLNASAAWRQYFLNGCSAIIGSLSVLAIRHYIFPSPPAAAPPAAPHSSSCLCH